MCTTRWSESLQFPQAPTPPRTMICPQHTVEGEVRLSDSGKKTKNKCQRLVTSVKAIIALFPHQLPPLSPDPSTCKQEVLNRTRRRSADTVVRRTEGDGDFLRSVISQQQKEIKDLARQLHEAKQENGHVRREAVQYIQQTQQQSPVRRRSACDSTLSSGSIMSFPTHEVLLVEEEFATEKLPF